MERRFDVRLEELLEDAVLDPRIPKGMLDRLEQFVEPYAARLTSSEQQGHVREYVSGLCSDVKRKNSEMIAYLHDQERHALQKFIGQSPWDDRPLIGELARQVGAELGEPDGVLVFDPSGFKNKEKARSGWRDNGAGVWEKSTTARWVYTWGMFLERSMPWWTRGCT